MNNIGKDIKYTEMFEGLFWLVLIIAILMLKYIFPNNEFVMKYFSGFFALVWLALILVLIFITGL